MAPQAVVERDRLPCVGRGRTAPQAAVAILGVDALAPAEPALLLGGAAGEIQPAPVAPAAMLVRPRAPEQHRGIVGTQPRGRMVHRRHVDVHRPRGPILVGTQPPTTYNKPPDTAAYLPHSSKR